MENYSHFIITRFNLNLYAQDKHDLPTRTDRWLEHRFEVFERYCLPSVAAQTSGNFTWLCLFDAATPESCRRRIEGYKARCPQFEAVYYTAAQAANLTENLRTTIAAYVSCDRKGRKSPPKLLITTNLDNDDAFSSDVVELLQRELRPAPGKRIYSLLYGYQYFTDRRFALKMRYTNNHFLTLAEPFDAHTETIISYRHTKAIRQLPTTYLSTARGKWLEIVHEDNVSNDFRINIKVWYIPLLYGRSFADFGLGGFRLSCARQWAATLLVVPARFFATAVRRLRRKWSK
ncbi:MAG: glycosyltransferase [Alistipes onderdonkii]